MNYLTTLYMRLLFRNRRAVFIPINVVSFFCIGLAQLLLGMKQQSWILLGFGSTIITITVGLFFTLHAYRLISVNFDAISVWPISIRSLNGSVWKLSFIMSTLLYTLGCTAAAFVEPAAIIRLISCYLFTLGVANIVYLYLGTLEKRRFDPSLSSFSTEGAMVSNPFRNNIFTVLFGIFLFGTSFLIHYTGYTLLYPLFLGIPGVAGILGYSVLLDKINRVVSRRNYIMKEGFREK